MNAVLLIEDFEVEYTKPLPLDPRPPLPPELWVSGLATFDKAWCVRNSLIYSYQCVLGCDAATGLFTVVAPKDGTK